METRINSLSTFLLLQLYPIALVEQNTHHYQNGVHNNNSINILQHRAPVSRL